MLINLAAMAAVALAMFLLWRYRKKLTVWIPLTACIAVLIMSGVNLVSVGGEFRQVRSQLSAIPEEEPSIPLSRNGKNVIVRMPISAMFVDISMSTRSCRSSSPALPTTRRPSLSGSIPTPAPRGSTAGTSTSPPRAKNAPT